MHVEWKFQITLLKVEVHKSSSKVNAGKSKLMICNNTERREG